MKTHAMHPRDPRYSLCGLYWWKTGDKADANPTCRSCQRGQRAGVGVAMTFKPDARATPKTWPCTIIAARYGGIYEGGEWLAFPLRFFNVPRAALGNDTDCEEWFHSADADFVGRGPTPDAAFLDMGERLLKHADRFDEFLLRTDYSFLMNVKVPTSP